jgi:hypothetical protein
MPSLSGRDPRQRIFGSASQNLTIGEPRLLEHITSFFVADDAELPSRSDAANTNTIFLKT